MAIEKIGSLGSVANVFHSTVQQHKRETEPPVDSVDISRKVPAGMKPTETFDPPFFPIGDTQSILKK